MDSSLRASAFAGLGAFALSIIVAAFSRVPFGALLLRALLSGLAFAGLFYGAIMLLRRFLPELFSDATSSAYAGQDASLGSVVDIVLPGGDAERDLQELEPGDKPRNADQAELESLPVDQPAPIAEPRRESAAAGELELEVANLRSESFVSSDPGEAPSPGGAPRPSVSLDELDTLPDLDGFSDAFTTTQAGDDEAAGSGVDASRLMGPSDSMPTAGAPDAGRDPAVLAKAVQTLLRKDQKGQL